MVMVAVMLIVVVGIKMALLVLSKMIKDDQKWSKMVKDDQIWSKMIKVMITSGLVELKPAQVSPAIAASIGCKGFYEEGMIQASKLPDTMILDIHIWIIIFHHPSNRDI